MFGWTFDTTITISRLIFAGIYDRHHYRDEIADALKRLARLITQIVDGEGGNVVPFIAR